MASNDKRKRKKSSSKQLSIKNPFYKTWWFGLIIGILVGFSISSFGENSTEHKEENKKVVEKNSQTKENTTNSELKKSNKENKKEVTGDFVDEASDAYFDGTMLKGNTYSIRITNHKIIPVGEKGNQYGDNPIIAFWYETIVSSDYQDNDVAINPSISWLLNFKAIQDNDKDKINELAVAPLPDDAFLKSQTADIKPGGTVENAVAYELTDDTTPVKLVAETMTGNDLGETEFKIK